MRCMMSHVLGFRGFYNKKWSNVKRLMLKNIRH